MKGASATSPNGAFSSPHLKARRSPPASSASKAATPSSSCKLVYGRVLTPANSKQQLDNLTSLRFGSSTSPSQSPGSDAAPVVRLGGAWHDLQKKKVEEGRYYQGLKDMAEQAMVKLNRVQMINEDLLAKARVRGGALLWRAIEDAMALLVGEY